MPRRKKQQHVFLDAFQVVRATVLIDDKCPISDFSIVFFSLSFCDPISHLLPFCVAFMSVVTSHPWGCRSTPGG